MKLGPAILGILALAGQVEAQSFTGELRVLGIAAHAPDVSRAAGYQDPADPPASSAMAGIMGDLSFVAGRFRLGPEASVLRGPERRVWSLGGVARYEMGAAGLRPYGLLGAGVYFWDRPILIDVPPTPAFNSWGGDASLFSVSLGGGVSFTAPGKRLAATAEVRLHRNLARAEFTGARSMVTLGLGGRIGW